MQKGETRGDVMGRTDTNTSAVLHNNDPLYRRHATNWHPTPKSPLFPLSINVDCDKGILTMSASLCLILCLLSPAFFASFVLSQVNCNHVIQTSTPFPLKWKKKWGTKSSSVHMKKEKKRRKKLVSSFLPPLFVRVSANSDIGYREKCSRSAVTARGAVVGLPGSWSFISGDLQRATPGISLPLWSGGFAARPRFDVSVWFGVCVCAQIMKGIAQAHQSDIATWIVSYHTTCQLK